MADYQIVKSTGEVKLILMPEECNDVLYVLNRSVRLTEGQPERTQRIHRIADILLAGLEQVGRVEAKHGA